MKDNENRNGFRRDRKQNNEQVEPSMVALLLLDTIKDQVKTFMALKPEDRYEGSKELYYVGSYPATLTSDNVPEAANYDVYQLERSVRLRREEPERLNRLSTAILLIDRETHQPAFYLTSYITPNLVANIRVVPYNNHGAWYKALVAWDSRDDANNG